MKPRKLIWLLLLVGIVLAGTTWLLDARADDTYNFYFQKAPGPVTVNQGATSQGSPDLKLKNEAVVPSAAAPAPDTLTAHPVPPPEDDSASALKRWRVSLGYTMLRGDTGELIGTTTTAQLPPEMRQYTLGARFDISPMFGVYAEGSYLKRNEFDDPTSWRGDDNRFDFGGGLTVTPLHVSFGRGYGLALTGIAGVAQIPNLVFDGTANYVSLAHTASPVLEARVSLILGNSVAMEAGYRKITRFDATTGSLALAFLL